MHPATPAPSTMPHLRSRASLLVRGIVLGLLLALAPAVSASASAGDLYSSVDTSRRQAGLPVLARDAALQDIAQRWAGRIAAAGVLSHNGNLRNEVPAGWESIGENVGYASTDGALHTAWMNSTGHRANILSSSYTNIGIGRVVAGGRVYAVQVFARYVGANARAGTVTGGPTGNLDGVAAIRDGLVVSGWAHDPKASSASVHVYVDGGLAATTRTSLARPDVQAAVPAAGSTAGFSVQLRGLATGRHSVCAYAVSSVGAGNPLLGCRTVTTSRQAFGRLDAATAVPGGVQVRGWALDPTVDTARVHVYVDGRARASVTTSASRPDVASAYRGYPATSGFAASVTGLAAGRHTVCVYAVSAAGGSNPSLGCRVVDVRANPFGSLDAVSVSSGRVVVKGWTIDGSTPASNDVHVYVSGAAGSRIGKTPAAQTRTDVAAVYPAYGSAHGYQLAVPVTRGSYQVCAYGIDTVAPGTNSLLGCRSVSVP